jgi:hypothetical protein
LNWLQVRLANGCHLDRNVKALVATRPFASVEVGDDHRLADPEPLRKMEACEGRRGWVRPSSSAGR